MVATALLSVTALAGCGSADDEASDPPDETPSASTGGSDEPSDSGKSDKGDKSDKSEKKDHKSDKNEKPDDDATKTDGDDDSGDTKSASSDYCDIVKQLKSDLDPSNSASLMRARDLDAVGDRVGDVADKAPGNVRAAWKRLGAAIDDVAAVLDKYDIDPSNPKSFQNLEPKEQKAIAKALQKYQSPKFTKATASIKTDVQRRCGITMQ